MNGRTPIFDDVAGEYADRIEELLSTRPATIDELLWQYPRSD